MTVAGQISQYARGRIVRRLARSMPWIGAAVALAAVGTAVRRKGLFGGVVDTALDVVPGVGAVKNVIEAVRGRDFIADKRVDSRPQLTDVADTSQRAPATLRDSSHAIRNSTSD